jgi:predicted kinase
LVCGPAAAGKSRYASALADQFGGCLLDSDQVTERLVRAGLGLAGMDPDDRDSVAYKAAYRKAVYETLFDLAREHLRRGPVVIAGPFTREGGEVDGLVNIERVVGQSVRAHFVWCDPMLRRERIEKRGESRDLPKLANWNEYLAGCREERPIWDHVFVDTGRESVDLG